MSWSSLQCVEPVTSKRNPVAKHAKDTILPTVVIPVDLNSNLRFSANESNSTMPSMATNRSFLPSIVLVLARNASFALKGDRPRNERSRFDRPRTDRFALQQKVMSLALQDDVPDNELSFRSMSICSEIKNDDTLPDAVKELPEPYGGSRLASF